MKNKITIVFLLTSFLLSACSTPVQIMSEPAGAEVEINGQPQGTTPLKLDLSDFAFTEYQIQLKKNGYKNKVERLQKEAKVGAIVGGIFFGISLLWCYGPAPVQNYKLELQK